LFRRSKNEIVRLRIETRVIFRRVVGSLCSRRPDRVRVLIVEDEVLLALHAEELVRELGFDTVGPVGRVKDAIELIASQDISIALLDVRLRRDEEVYPVADLLRKKAIPFILTTAFASDGIDKRYGKEIVIMKPYSQEELEAKLRQALKLS
jgi:CheY-like chemotaxis protein